MLAYAVPAAPAPHVRRADPNAPPRTSLRVPSSPQAAGSAPSVRPAPCSRRPGVPAVVFALVVVWRRTPNAGRAPLAQAADRSQLDSAATEAEHIRTRAQAEATGILERARQEAEQAAQGRREVEEEIRAVKDEVRELRGDLERRETRLADRERLLDEEVMRIEDRGQGHCQAQE